MKANFTNNAGSSVYTLYILMSVQDTCYRLLCAHFTTSFSILFWRIFHCLRASRALLRVTAVAQARAGSDTSLHLTQVMSAFTLEQKLSD